LSTRACCSDNHGSEVMREGEGEKEKHKQRKRGETDRQTARQREGR